LREGAAEEEVDMVEAAATEEVLEGEAFMVAALAAVATSVDIEAVA
jgi:hypothetical protein